MKRRWGVVVMALAVASHIQAQASKTTHLDTLAGSVLPANLATITTDTGDFAPGHRDFTTYTRPSFCLAAAATTTQVIRNRLAALLNEDSLQFQPLHDTVPTEGVRVAKACAAARFTVMTTSPDELRNLFPLALLVGNDSLAQAVIARLLASTPTAAARDEIELAALSTYLGTSVEGFYPIRWRLTRLASAEALVARMDSGATALRGHFMLLGFAIGIHDSSLVNHEMRRISTVAHQATGKDVNVASGILEEAYAALMPGAIATSPDAMVAVAQRARDDLHSFGSVAICASWIPHCTTATVEQIQAFFLQYGGFHEWQYGESIPPLHARYWFPPPAQHRDTVFPVPGHVTVFVQSDVGCQFDAEGYGIGFEVCYAVETNVRRWVQRYGSDRVKIVIVSNTFGHAFLSGAETPAQEAERVRWYYQDFLGLPVTVAVQEPQLHILPAPDGRRFGQWEDGSWGDTTLFTAQMTNAGGVVVTDQGGRLVYGQFFANGRSEYLDVDPYIQRALAFPAVASPLTHGAR